MAVSTVVEWVHREWALLTKRTLEQTRDRFTVEIARDELPITLVAVGNEIVFAGVASLRERDSNDWLPGASPWICNVYVCAKARGLGIAGQLCRTLEQRALRLGYESVYLTTTRADSLYHKLGYQEVRRSDHGGQAHYVLARSIS